MNNHHLRANFLAALIAGFFTLNSGQAWSESEMPGATNEQEQLRSLVDCPFSLQNRPQSTRVILQIINNQFHKWEEHDLEANSTCLVLVKPAEKMLSAAEANTLLEKSSAWLIQEPGTQATETLSADDPQLNVPPAVAPAPSGAKIPESNAPDSDAGPSSSNSQGTAPSAINGAIIGTDFHLPEIVIGTDDRERVTSTTMYPWWTIGYQTHSYPDNSAYRCTGFVVGPYMAMTNGHCVYDSNSGGWATSMSLAAGQSQVSEGAPVVRPYGQQSACHWRTNSNYTATAGLQYDYAAMFFRDSFSTLGVTTYMPLVFDANPISVNTAGYPATAQGQGTYDMWWAYDGTNVQVVDRILRHTADTSGGQSGSPLWLYSAQTQQRWVVALHAFGNSDGYNGGPRLVSQNRDLIETWMANQADYCGGGGGIFLPGTQMLLLDD